jgi:hypothetical protein
MPASKFEQFVDRARQKAEGLPVIGARIANRQPARDSPAPPVSDERLAMGQREADYFRQRAARASSTQVAERLATEMTRTAASSREIDVPSRGIEAVTGLGR